MYNQLIKEKMKGKILSFAIMAILCTVCSSLCAQDIIILRNGVEIKATVTRIGDEEIEYNQWGCENCPKYSKKVSNVLKIKFQNGTEQIFDQNSNSSSSVTTTPNITIVNNNNNNNYNNGGGYYSESSTLKYMVRSGKDILLNGFELTDDQIKLLCGEEKLEVYSSACGQWIASKWLTGIGWPVWIGGIITLIADGEIGTPVFIIGNGLLASGYALRGISAGRINWIVNEYNNGQLTSWNFSLQPSLMAVNMPDSRTMAVGATLSINF